MSDPTRWWHLILHTRGSWLHGDPRGFRSRDHRIHSSGDYKNPPPEGEHQNLHRFQQSHSRPPLTLPPETLPIVGEALRQKCARAGHTLPALCVNPTHAHLLIQPLDTSHSVQTLTASLKQASSHAVRHILPGRVWAAGGKPIAIDDRPHQLRVFQYILRHADEGAWVWHLKMKGDAEGTEGA